MPFTTQQFFQTFADYNGAIFPIQFVLPVLALIAVASACRCEASKDGAAPWLLGMFWVWAGAVYHIVFFSRIDPAAWLFGTLFIAQGLLFMRAAIRKELDLYFLPDIRGWAGGAMIAYALVFYPLIEVLDGKPLLSSPTFGTPCPLTIFTFGMLTLSRRQVPWYLLVIPAVWSLIGAVAAFSFGVAADVMLPVAGVVGTLLAITVDVRSTRRTI